MAQDPKIIKFSSPESTSEVDPGRTSSLPAPLRTVRKEAVAFIKARLSALFDNADDSLFEMADRASSSTDQALFFEAMRAVRLQRHAITTSCCQRLVQGMEALNDNTAAKSGSAVNFALDTLSLVQPDDLEQTVALDSMIGRVAGRNKQALSHLAIRLNSLVKAPVDVTNNPLGPGVLAQIFVDALGEMSLDIKVRLIVLKLFERYVFNPIDPLFAEANARLISAGVLPDLKSDEPPKRQQSFSGDGTRAGAAQRETLDDDDQQRVLSLFSELIGNWRHASGDAALSRVASSAAPPLQSSELLGVLARLPVDSLAESGFQRQDLRVHINQLLQDQRDHQGQRRAVDRVDEDVISLVSMLFDFILDDQQLPAALRAMIGRLQLPILRVAIADKRFFGQASHPARRLLNELARATMGWSDQDDLRRDQLHVLLESIVQRLLDEPEPQPEMFSAMHAELTSFVHSEKRRSERLEQRTRDAEEGKARVDAARSEVASRLNAMLLGKTLPVFVVDLLRDTWSQVMQMTWLREGPDSSAMQAAGETARNLLLSIKPVGAGDVLEREELNKKVRGAVAEGLTLLGMHAEEGAPLLVRLKQLQQVMLREVSRPDDIDTATLPAVEVASSQPQATSSENKSPVTSPSSAAPAPALKTALPEHPLPAAVSAGRSASDSDNRSVAQPAVGEPGLPPAKTVRPPMPVIEIRQPVIEVVAAKDEEAVSGEVDPQAAAWVEQLHTGSWFEYRAHAEAAAQRCKLAAVISFSGKYIFVNRAGMKVAEFPRVDLARHHAMGLIRLLNDNQLFDRALESVIGNLRQVQAGRNT